MAGPLNWRSSLASRLLVDVVQRGLVVACSARRHLQVVARRDVSHQQLLVLDEVSAALGDGPGNARSSFPCRR
jgi:hypothetical protein